MRLNYIYFLNHRIHVSTLESTKVKGNDVFEFEDALGNPFLFGAGDTYDFFYLDDYCAIVAPVESVGLEELKEKFKERLYRRESRLETQLSNCYEAISLLEVDNYEKI